jgi:hypothetical protein
MFHRNARLTPPGRQILVERVLAGRPIAHVAKEMGISRTCAHRWLSRYRATAGTLPRFPGRLGGTGRQTHHDQTPPSLAKRQSRTLQPHLARRLRLPASLHIQPSTHRRPAALARLLRQPPATRQPRRQTTHQPVQPTYWLSTTRAALPRTAPTAPPTIRSMVTLVR